MAFAGCSKAVEAVKTGAEVARVAKDAQDGEFTVKGKDGETIVVDAEKAGKGGTVTVTDADGEVSTVTTTEDKDGEGGTWTATGPDGTTTVTTVTGEDGEATVVTTDAEGNETTIETGANAVTEDDIGIKFYPGAAPEGGGQISGSTEAGGNRAGVMLTTPDSFEKVAQFYKDEYDTDEILETPTALMMTVGEGDDSAKITVVREASEDVTRIAILRG